MLTTVGLACGCDGRTTTGPIGGPTVDGGVGPGGDGGGVQHFDAHFLDSSVPPPIGVDGGPTGP